MAVETPGLWKDLNILWPDDDDFALEGAQHMRVIKESLQIQFPNLEAAVTVTAAELNALAGVSGNIETRLAALEADQDIPSGVNMLFYEESAPAGWTINGAVNDRVCRVVNTTGASTGGNWAITGLTADPHTHPINVDGNHEHPTGSGGDFEGTIPGSGLKHTAAGAHAHGGNTGLSGSTGVNGDGTWRPAYADFLICTRN